jgi:hypothetical protein
MEGHLVHYNSKYKNFQEAVTKPDGLAVTGFFIHGMGDKDCPEFKKISDGIERITKPGSKTRLGADCLSFLKLQELNKHYYRYACDSPGVKISHMKYQIILKIHPSFSSFYYYIHACDHAFI